MKRQSSSQWASLTFIMPKKGIAVRTITNFRELNKRIVRRPYPVPKISTTLQKLEGFTYATALDLNMGYYIIRLDPRCWVRRRYCSAGITKLGERVAKNTKLELQNFVYFSP